MAEVTKSIKNKHAGTLCHRHRHHHLRAESYADIGLAVYDSLMVT